MNLPLELDAFRQQEPHNFCDLLCARSIIENILCKIQSILEQKNLQNEEIQDLSKEIYTRAAMLDTCFNPIFSQDENVSSFSSDGEMLDWIESLLEGEKEIERIPNQLYHHTPAIGVYLKGIPLLLSYNYLEVLGAKNVLELKNELTEGTALNKYYTPESIDVMNTQVSKLHPGECCQNMILTSKHGKEVDWTICRFSNGIEIRIGKECLKREDVSPTNKMQSLNGFKETPAIIQEYRTKVQELIGEIHPVDDCAMKAFEILGVIIDTLWANGYYLMSLIKNEHEQTTEMNGQFGERENFSFTDLKDYVSKMSTQGETDQADGVSSVQIIGENSSLTGYKTIIENEKLGVKRTFIIANPN